MTPIRSIEYDVHPIERVLELVLRHPVRDTIASHVNAADPLGKSEYSCERLDALFTQFVVRQIEEFNIYIAATDSLCQIFNSLVSNLIARKIKFLEPLCLLDVLVDFVDVIISKSFSIKTEDAFSHFTSESSRNCRFFTDFLCSCFRCIWIKRFR